MFSEMNYQSVRATGLTSAEQSAKPYLFISPYRVSAKKG